MKEFHMLTKKHSRIANQKRDVKYDIINHACKLLNVCSLYHQDIFVNKIPKIELDHLAFILQYEIGPYDTDENHTMGDPTKVLNTKGSNIREYFDFLIKHKLSELLNNVATIVTHYTFANRATLVHFLNPEQVQFVRGILADMGNRCIEWDSATVTRLSFCFDLDAAEQNRSDNTFIPFDDRNIIFILRSLSEYVIHNMEQPNAKFILECIHNILKWVATYSAYIHLYEDSTNKLDIHPLMCFLMSDCPLSEILEAHKRFINDLSLTGHTVHFSDRYCVLGELFTTYR